MRIIAFSISLIFHLLLLNLYWEKHNQVNEIAVKDLPLRIQVRLQKQMVQSEKVKKQEKSVDKVYLGKENQSVKRNKTVRKKGAFKSKKKQAQKKKKIKSLRISQKDLVKAINEESASPDYTPDAELGDVVEFNTIRYKYYSFFSRIQNRLANNWRPEGIRSYKTLITEVVVTIDRKGYVTNIKLRKSSGNNYLDNSALEAFKKAMPFTNPPRDLIAKGNFSFEWKFIMR